MNIGIIAALMLALGVGSAGAVTIGDAFKGVVRDSQWRILDSATPIYFYDAKNGKSEKGVMSSIWQYKFITADYGYVNQIDSSASGHPLIGGSVHADMLLETFAPRVKESLLQAVPDSARNFVSMINCGYAIGHNFETDHFFHGVYTGLEFKFK